MEAGKIIALKRMLPEMKARGDRVLLFSQFTQVLEILEVVLDTMGIKYLKLTGQTNVTDRQSMVDEYTNNPEITVFCSCISLLYTTSADMIRQCCRLVLVDSDSI